MGADLRKLRSINHAPRQNFPLFHPYGGLYCPRLKGGVSVSAQRVDEAWQVRAACRGPQAAVFFPPSHFERKSEKLRREEQAKAICSTCPVAEPCLEYAVRIREPLGIWGGLNETERRQLLG